jgi:ubiquinone/menaquinone biosynthesis C-methylase UbiE
MDTTLHMIPDCQKGVSEVARVLRNGGLFLCATPAVGISSEFDRTWDEIAARRSLHTLDEEAVRRLCSSNEMRGALFPCEEKGVKDRFSDRAS